MKSFYLSNSQFISAVASILNLKHPYPVARKLKLLKQKLETEMAMFQEEHQKILKEYCIKDENGEPALTTKEDGLQYFQFPTEATEALNRAMFDLQNADIEIEKVKLEEKALEKLEVTTDELELIDQVIEFV